MNSTKSTSPFISVLALAPIMLIVLAFYYAAIFIIGGLTTIVPEVLSIWAEMLEDTTHTLTVFYSNMRHYIAEILSWVNPWYVDGTSAEDYFDLLE